MPNNFIFTQPRAGEALRPGQITRYSANNIVVKALADTNGHVRGFAGIVAAPGIIASGGPVNIASAGAQSVQVVSGLTLTPGDALYVSDMESGKATNVAPAIAIIIGAIIDTSDYATRGTVKVNVSFLGAAAVSAAGTLAQAYAAGSSSADQTLPLTDADGGGVIFDATNGGFTGASAFRINTAAGGPFTIARATGLVNVGASGIAFGAGSAVAVSAASTGLIRYNEGTNHLEASENGGAYFQILTTAGGGAVFPGFGITPPPAAAAASALGSSGLAAYSDHTHAAGWEAGTYTAPLANRLTGVPQQVVVSTTATISITQFPAGRLPAGNASADGRLRTDALMFYYEASSTRPRLNINQDTAWVSETNVGAGFLINVPSGVAQAAVIQLQGNDEAFVRALQTSNGLDIGNVHFQDGPDGTTSGSVQINCRQSTGGGGAVVESGRFSAAGLLIPKVLAVGPTGVGEAITGAQIWIQDNGAVANAPGGTAKIIYAGGATQWPQMSVDGGAFADIARAGQGTAAASGSTLTPPSNGTYVHVTGTTTINYIVTDRVKPGHPLWLYFESAVTLANNTGSVPGSTLALQLQGGVNANMTAGSLMCVVRDTTQGKWVEAIRFNQGLEIFQPTTVASATSATLDAIKIPALTITVTGNTAITTAAGFNLYDIEIPTYSDASAVTVTNAATFTVKGPPAGGGAGPVTISNAYAIWAQSGFSRFDTALTMNLPPNVGGSTATTNFLQLGSSATRDKVFIAPGGVQITDSTARAYIFIDQSSTDISNGTAATLLTTVNIDTPVYTTGGAVTIAEATSFYIANAPTTPAGTTASYAMHVAAGASRFDGPLLANINVDAPTATTFAAFASSATRDKIYFQPGGLAIPDSTARQYIYISQSTTDIGAGVAATLLTTLRINTPVYTNSGGTGTIIEATTLYIDNAPTVFGGSGAATYAIHVAAGMTSIDGALRLGALDANGTVATVMTNLGPAGSHTTIQEWLTFTSTSGNQRWIPCF